ncbi:zinc finger, CCHC-type containing protein [Tanacetum coccineum]
MKVDGTIDKFKARLVIQGFRQKEGIDYFDTYTPVARITTIRLLLALAATHNLVIHQMDVKTAFLNGDLNKEFSSDYSHRSGRNLKLNTGKPVDQLEYSRAIGYLMYAMTCTRPDIVYAVGRLSNDDLPETDEISYSARIRVGEVVYVLTTPMPKLMEDSTVEAIRLRAKWENDDYICRWHILNGMSDSLFDVYTNIESAKELWDSLKSKYMALGSSNMTEEGKNKNNKQNKGKKRDFKEHGSGLGSNKKPKLECWKCGKTGHFKRDCHSGNKKNTNAGGSGKGSKDHSQD